jgi:hypothetical protein
MQTQNVTVHFLCIIERNAAVNNMELECCIGSTAMDIVCIVLGLQNIYHGCEQCKRAFLRVKFQIIFSPIFDKI